MNAFTFRLRLVGAFFGTAFVLVGGASALGTGRPSLRVRVPPDSTTQEVQRLSDEALLVEVGMARGWQSDALIVERIVKSLSYVGVTGSRADILARAEALDLPRRDPLVRARLVERARAALVVVPEPTDLDLKRAMEAEPERYRRPAVVRFRHALLDALGPDLLLGPHPTRSEPEIARALGPEAAARIVALPVAQPNDPPVIVTSPRGRHQVVVEAHFPGAVPALAAIRTEVAGRWRELERERRWRAALTELRAAVDVEIEVAQ